MSQSSRNAFNEYQRLLDRDPYFQQLQDERDQTWWQTQDPMMNGGSNTNPPHDNSTEEK